MVLRSVTPRKPGKVLPQKRQDPTSRSKSSGLESKPERNSVAKPTYICPGLREEQEQSMSGNYFYGLEAHLPQVLSFVDDAKPLVPRAAWTDQSKMHVTLLFCGKKCPDDNTAMEAFRQLCCEARPLKFQAKGLGTFNNRSGPRVLFARVEPQETLKAWHKSLGGRPDTFTPHLTLAKLEDIGDAEPDFANIAQQHTGIDFGTCTINELRLYQTQGEGRPYLIKAWHRLCG